MQHSLCAQVTVVHFIADFRRKSLDEQSFWILLLYFITASDCRSRCLRFVLYKVLVVSLIVDFLRKSLREEIF